MNKEGADTKEKIIDAANDLFSQYGFEGTSVRDIAAASGVNIASINYHFRSKQALYWEIFIRAHEWLESGIEEITQRTQTLDQVVPEIFDFMLKEKSYIRNTIKLMMSESIEDEPSDPDQIKRLKIGPPGSAAIGAIIEKEIHRELSPAELFWGVKSILGALMHWGMMCSTSKFEVMQQRNPMLEMENVKDGIVRLSRVVLDHLKSNRF